MRAFRIEHLTRVQQHDAPPNAGKIAINFVSLDRRMILGDRFQDCTQLGDIPLTVVNLVNQMPPDSLTGELEYLIESPARGDDAQVVVEHQQRVTNGIDDGVRECGSVWNDGEWRILRLCRRQHVNFPSRFRTRTMQREFSLSGLERPDASLSA